MRGGGDEAAESDDGAGTYLGNVYADTFPTRVRVAALDGPLDPNS